MGRFISTDPKGYETGLNLYTYALNNPHLFRDPMGTDPYWAGGHSGGGVTHSNEVLDNEFGDREIKAADLAEEVVEELDPKPEDPQPKSKPASNKSSFGTNGGYQSGGGCGTCDGPQFGGPQPPQPPAKSSDDERNKNNPAQAVAKAAGNVLDNPPDSTLASGILGGLEQAGKLGFFRQSINPVTALKINGHHLVEPFKFAGRIAAKVSVGLDLLFSGLEILKIFRGNDNTATKSLKVGTVAIANTLAFMAAGAVIGLAASTIGGVALAVATVVVVSILAENIKREVFHLIDQGAS